MSDLELAQAPAADDITAWLATMAESLTPLVHALQQLGDNLGALGRTLCAVLDEFARDAREEAAWPWSTDAARWRPESVD